MPRTIQYQCFRWCAWVWVLLLCASCSCQGFPLCLTAADCGGQEICFEGACRPGADLDCDGALDPIPLSGPQREACYPPQEGCQKVGDIYLCKGRCQAGQRLCGASGWGRCEGFRGPSAELCNGHDDDCNGEIDEADPKAGQACQVPGALGPCAAGRWACQKGELRCSSQRQPQPEVCDGEDNNCDGKVDEGCCVPPFTRRRTFPHEGYHLGVIIAVRYSPDGRFVATGGAFGEIKLWDAATRTFLRTLRGHSRDVVAMAFHPDATKPSAQILVSVSEDARVIFWEIPSGKRLHTMDDHAIGLRAVDVHPDGSIFATGAKDGIIRLWRWDPQMQRHTRLRSLQGHSQPLRDLRFHPDGERLLSSSEDGTLRVWRISDGASLHVWTVTSATSAPIVFNKIAIHPDGKRIAAGLMDHSARVWRLDQPQAAPLILKDHLAGVRSVAWVPGTSQLVAVADAPFNRPEKFSHRVWDTTTGKLIAAPEDRLSFGNRDLAFAPTGSPATLVIASHDKSVQWWNAESWQLIGRQRLPYQSTHSRHIKAMALFADKGGALTLFSGSEDQDVRAWDVGSGEGVGQPMLGHRGWVFRLLLDPAQTYLASLSADQTVRLWQPSTRALLRTIKIGSPQRLPTAALAASADGSLLATATKDGAIDLWDTAMGQRRTQLKLASSAAVWLRFQADGKQLMVISESGDAVRFALGTGASSPGPALFPDGRSGGVSAVRMSPDGALLAVGTNKGQLQLLSWPAGSLRHSLQTVGSDQVFGLLFTPSGGHLIAGLGSGDVAVWEVASGKLVQQLFAHSRSTWDLVFAPDGKRFFTGGGDARLIEWSCGP